MILSIAELNKIEAIWKNKESLAKIESNWKLFEKLCSETGSRAKQLNDIINHFAERAILAPASTRFEYHNAFPGGFIDHSLRVFSASVSLATALKTKVPKESLIISSLFHDWGKVGDMENDYYFNQTSDWHRQRGQTYIRNENIRMTNAQLGLYTLSQFGVKLSEDEYLAILLNDGQYTEANKDYAMKEPKLALICHMADRWATQCEKNRKTILDDDHPLF